MPFVVIHFASIIDWFNNFTYYVFTYCSAVINSISFSNVFITVQMKQIFMDVVIHFHYLSVNIHNGYFLSCNLLTVVYFVAYVSSLINVSFSMNISYDFNGYYYYHKIVIIEKLCCNFCYSVEIGLTL